MAEVNPLLLPAVETVTAEMARAFDVIWSKPGAAAVMEGFLAGRVAFQIDVGGVTTLERDPGAGEAPQEPEPPSGPWPGMYL